MNHHLMHPDEFDADAADLAPTDEIEYEELGGIDTAEELELLVPRMRAMRFRDV